jgi:hypothetical protein
MIKSSFPKGISIVRGIFTLSILSLFFISLKANDIKFNPILCNDNALDGRVIGKLVEIANETKQKTDVNLYVCIKGSYFKDIQDNRENKIKFKKIKEFENKLIEKVKKPYVILTMSYIDHHVNLLISEKLKPAIDKDNILNGYVIPLLSSYDKNDKRAKVSAATLNGYSEVVSSVANFKNTKIESNINSDGKIAADIWRNIMYTLVIGGLILYGYANYKVKQKQKGS